MLMENVAFAHISKWYFGNVQQVMLNVIYQTLQSFYRSLS